MEPEPAQGPWPWAVRAGGIVLVLLTAVLALPLFASRAPVSQPIGFNHKHHTDSLSLGCEFCHRYVQTSAHPGLPGAEVCSLCHSTPQGESEEAVRLTRLLTAGEPLQFNKLFRLPDHVFYTHRRHVGIAQIECETCHGGIAQTERPPTRPMVRITMDTCLDCHRELGQSVDCNACHR